MYISMWGCFDKYIRVATWLPQTKIPGSAPGCGEAGKAQRKWFSSRRLLA